MLPIPLLDGETVLWGRERKINLPFRKKQHYFGEHDLAKYHGQVVGNKIEYLRCEYFTNKRFALKAEYILRDDIFNKEFCDLSPEKYQREGDWFVINIENVDKVEFEFIAKESVND